MWVLERLNNSSNNQSKLKTKWAYFFTNLLHLRQNKSVI